MLQIAQEKSFTHKRFVALISLGLCEQERFKSLLGSSFFVERALCPRMALQLGNEASWWPFLCMQCSVGNFFVADFTLLEE